MVSSYCYYSNKKHCAGRQITFMMFIAIMIHKNDSLMLSCISHNYFDRAVIRNHTQLWMIHISLPDKRLFILPCMTTTTASWLYQLIIQISSRLLQSSESQLYSLYNGRHFATVNCPICVMGMYNSCSVVVNVRLLGGVFVTGAKTSLCNRKRKRCLSTQVSFR